MQPSIISRLAPGLLLIISLQVLTAPAIRADDDDEDKCRRLEAPRLFGTKTLYADARKALRRLDHEDHLPKPFDDDSLEHEHKDLLKDGCSPVGFYFMGRHSARFPDGEDIEQYNKDLLALIDKMKNAPQVRGGCRKRRQEFLDWRPVMEAKQDNLITELGGQEEREIARRFKHLYPEFFDATKTDIKIGVTKKLRTAQTGSEFLKEVDGLNLDESCKATPSNDPFQRDYNVDKVLEAACYKYLTKNHEASFLDFHKQCEQISGEEKIKDPLIERVKAPKLKERMLERVTRKLGLLDDNSNKDRNESEAPPPVSFEMLDSIWNMCKFETAMRNESIWCSLFGKKDIQMLEYIEDVNTYIKSAYGPKANARQSCPVVGNLVESFQEIIRMYEDGQQQHRKRAYFYFSHADPIKKLLAAFGMFKDDESFSPKQIEKFESDLKMPKKRHWRSSLISPFSANLAFVLYRCPRKFKVLASVTEQPVKLGGCKDTDCNIQRFMDTYSNMRDDCNLNEICKRPS
uniref:Multiple inositol polyphosphate phosphatase 1 n=1 Tax=Aceria tosichella TaxID=561515 RepID=A0A6G1S819_9ACAR